MPHAQISTGQHALRSSPRRLVLVGALGLSGTALVGVPAAEAAPSVGSKVVQTYLAVGGRDVLGAAKHKQQKRRISHHNTYGQQFEHGTVWWGSDVGKVDLPYVRVRPDSAPNFRPVVGVVDLWRSDDLDGCTALEERIVVDLGIETMIAMNSGGDPSIPGVDRSSYRIATSSSPGCPPPASSWSPTTGPSRTTWSTGALWTPTTSPSRRSVCACRCARRGAAQGR